MFDVFKLIVNSICPGIYGNEVVKMALALALFGGNQKHGEEVPAPKKRRKDSPQSSVLAYAPQ